MSAVAKPRVAPFAAFPVGDPASWRNMLIYKIVAINFIGIVLLALAHQAGWIYASVVADSSRIVFAIAAFFVFGMLLAIMHSIEISKELNRVKEFDHKNLSGEYPVHSGAIRCLKTMHGKDSGSRTNLSDAYENNMLNHVSTIDFIVVLLVTLGLLGTVVGFILSLPGITTININDTEALKGLILPFLKGLGVALYTTLVGSVFSIWLSIANHYILKSVANLSVAIKIKGELMAPNMVENHAKS